MAIYETRVLSDFDKTMTGLTLLTRLYFAPETPLRTLFVSVRVTEQLSARLPVDTYCAATAALNFIFPTSDAQWGMTLDGSGENALEGPVPSTVKNQMKS